MPVPRRRAESEARSTRRFSTSRMAHSRSRSRSPVQIDALPQKIYARVVAFSEVNGSVSNTFRFSPDLPLGRMMAAWCELQQTGPEEVIFLRQGLEIRHDMTVAGHRWWPCPSCGEVVFVAAPRHCMDDDGRMVADESGEKAGEEDPQNNMAP